MKLKKYLLEFSEIAEDWFNEHQWLENNLNIDLSKYPSGTYYLYFNSENEVQGCRLEEKQKISTKIILNK